MPKSLSESSGEIPKTFVFELTRRCNHRCSYCYAFWGVDAEGRGGMEIDLAFPTFTRFIDRLLQEVRVENIALSGGEPLLCADLDKILEYLRSRNITSTVISNGTLITPERAKALCMADIVEVTLLSYDPVVHDRIVRRTGAWDAAIHGIANLHEAGGHWEAVFVATKENIAHAGKTARLAIALDAEGLMFNRINLGIHNKAYASTLLPTPEMLCEALRDLDAVTETLGFPIVVSVPIEPCVVDIKPYKHINFGFCPLGGANSYFTIDPEGNIRMCNHSPVILGNIERDSFLEIFHNHSYMRRFRDNWPEQCIKCAPELKELCKGGCKASAEQCFGTLDTVDPFVLHFLKNRVNIPQEV